MVRNLCLLPNARLGIGENICIDLQEIVSDIPKSVTQIKTQRNGCIAASLSLPCVHQNFGFSRKYELTNNGFAYTVIRVKQF